MHQHLHRFIALVIPILATSAVAQQKPIKIYDAVAPGSEHWTWHEDSSSNNRYHVKTVYNITEPSLTVFKPVNPKPNGTAVIICPGGGFHFLAIDHEGNNAARILAKAGITAFVLRYRLVHVTSSNPFDDMLTTTNKKAWDDESLPIMPLAIADGRQAIAYVRRHAKEYNLAADRIGILGFSAGGMVAVQSAWQNDSANRPDFIAPIYGDKRMSLNDAVSFANVPPMFLACAEDDEFGFADSALTLYRKWYDAKRPAEMHLFAKGGHGFGVGSNENTTGGWIQTFCRWLQTQNLLSRD